MTASVDTRPLTGSLDAGGASLLLGIGPVVRKEIHEWFASRRAAILLAISSLMMVLLTLNARLALWSASAGHVTLPANISVDPTINVLAKWPQWYFFFAIVFTASLVVSEREHGTLDWSLSKPLSRTALLLGKWVAAVAMLIAFGLVVPMALSTAVAVVAYGMPDLGAIAVATVLLATVPVFFAALTIALGAVLPSQVAVAGIAFAVAVAPGLIGTFLPDVAAALPPSSGPWAVAVALGAPAGPWTPIGWFVGCAVVGILGIAAFRRGDL